MKPADNRPPCDKCGVASASHVRCDGCVDALQAQVTALREALEKTPALVWEMLKLREGASVATQGREIIDDVLRPVLSDTSATAREHDTRVRDAALEEAAQVTEAFAPEGHVRRMHAEAIRALKSLPPDNAG